MDALTTWYVLRLAVGIMALAMQAVFWWGAITGTKKAKLIRYGVLALLLTAATILSGVHPPQAPTRPFDASRSA
jgi:hypothetical protein